MSAAEWPRVGPIDSAVAPPDLSAVGGRVTLTDFLLARIAEDEAVAKDAGGGRWDEWALESGAAEHIARHDPARVLAEREAKRRIVASAQELVTHGNDAARAIASDILGALALPYADHPDYREEWKP